MSAPAKKDPHQLLKRPVITEKSSNAHDEANQVAFRVPLAANKIEIKAAVEEVYSVEVLRVNTSVVHGKTKRRGRRVGRLPNWKKAVVTLAAGSTIDFYQEV
jgi:large subunit ribosomal protein L23